MKIRRSICIFLVLVLTVCFASCAGRNPQRPTQTPATAQPGETQPAESTEAPEKTTENNDEPTLAPLEFDKTKAQELGAFDTEIFGELTVYYQDDRIVIFDAFDTQRFALYANSYEPAYQGAPVELNGEDVNFDGYTDFYLLYSKGNLNSFYFFWIWNMDTRTFEYYLPLSSVPSPEIDAARKRIVSKDRTDLETVVTTEYIWQNGNILPIAHGEHSVTATTEATTAAPGPEDVDVSLSLLDGHILSSVTMNTNADSKADWLCGIEDERIVRVYSETKDPLLHTHRFIFRGLAQGTTTVVLRYAESWSTEYVAQRILNITVNPDATLKITIVE